MQLQMFDPSHTDFSKNKVLIGISGGINSAALLCYLASEYPAEFRPREVHFFAVQLKEHSPDTFRFMKDCIRYGAKKFDNVRWCVSWGSVNRFFEGKNMIPHPILSPCSEHLKIIPMNKYREKHNIEVDLIGYVREERSRINRQLKKSKGKYHPIAHLSNEDCFSLVKREIGWYPAIYDIRRNGKRVFTHNNCLPCKNMSGKLTLEEATGQYASVKLYFPEYYQAAVDLSEKIASYWGRNDDQDMGECKICEYL